MKLVKIMWIGPDREVPGYGVGVKGIGIEVPEHMAKSYVYQGLADYVKAKQDKTKKLEG